VNPSSACSTHGSIDKSLNESAWSLSLSFIPESAGSTIFPLPVQMREIKNTSLANQSESYTWQMKVHVATIAARRWARQNIGCMKVPIEGYAFGSCSQAPVCYGSRNIPVITITISLSEVAISCGYQEKYQRWWWRWRGIICRCTSTRRYLPLACLFMR